MVGWAVGRARAASLRENVRHAFAYEQPLERESLRVGAVDDPNGGRRQRVAQPQHALQHVVGLVVMVVELDHLSTRAFAPTSSRVLRGTRCVGVTRPCAGG